MVDTGPTETHEPEVTEPLSVEASSPPTTEEPEPMYEDTKPETNLFSVQTIATPTATTGAPSSDECGPLSQATIEVAGSIVRVSIPSRRGSNNVTEVPVPVAAAWLIHCAANPAFESAKTLLPL